MADKHFWDMDFVDIYFILSAEVSLRLLCTALGCMWHEAHVRVWHSKIVGTFCHQTSTFMVTDSSVMHALLNQLMTCETM